MRSRFIWGLSALLAVGCVKATLFWTRPPGLAGELGLVSVSPVAGGHRGGYLITVRGGGFTTQTIITVSGVRCPLSTLVSSEELICTMPFVPASFSSKDVVVSDPGGSSTTLAAAFLPRSFLYMVRTSASEVVGFEVAEADGGLTLFDGPHTSLIGNPDRIALSEDGRVLAVASTTNFQVATFLVNPLDGTLTFGDRRGCGPSLDSIALHPSAIAVYCTDASTGLVTRLKLDPLSGALSTGTSLTIFGALREIQVHPSGASLYLAEETGGFLYQVPLGAAGELGLIVRFPTDPGSKIGDPKNLKLTPRGDFLYVGDMGQSLIGGKRVDAVTGALTDTSPDPYSSGLGGQRLAISPNGENLYVMLLAQTLILTRAISVAGDITGTSQIPFSGTAINLAVDATNSYAYLIFGNSVNKISIFRRDSTNGTLSLVAEPLDFSNLRDLVAY